MNSEHKILP